MAMLSIEPNSLRYQKYSAMSHENSTYRNTQARMENQIYNLDQDLATARKETQSLTRAKKDAEKKLTVEVCFT